MDSHSCTIMSLNCESLNAKFSKIKLMIDLFAESNKQMEDVYNVALVSEQAHVRSHHDKIQNILVINSKIVYSRILIVLI